MKQIDHFTGTTRKQQSLKAGVALLLMGVMLALLPAALQAQALQPFTQRTSDYSPDMPIYHIKGDYTMIGNTSVTFNAVGLNDNCNNNHNNSNSNDSYNYNRMKYVDVDGTTFSTINSSTAALTFSDEFGANPACSEVVYAGLYWTGRTDRSYVSTSRTTRVESGETVGGYTLTITQNGNDRIFTFTKPGSESVVLTMTKEEEVRGGGPQRWTRYSYYVYNISNGAETEIYDNVPDSREKNNDENQHTASIAVQLPGTSNTITQLYWNSTLNACYATIEVHTTTINPWSYGGSEYYLNKIKIKHANESTYTEVTASPTNVYGGTSASSYIYVAYAEVTDIVRRNGLGNYTVADLVTNVGQNDGTGWIGCWGMVVVYENSKMKWRDITLFDGFANVEDGNDVTIPISGFKTVQVGDVSVKLGMMAAEGDRGISGDGCAIQKLQSSTYQDLVHSGNTTSNFFNSSIQTGGNYRYPNYVNNTGIDIAMFNIPNENNEVLDNEQTSTTFQFTSTQDLYFPFCFVMGVDAYIPEAEALSGVMNLNEDDVTIDLETGNYLIEPGKEITFEVEVKNFGTEDIVNAKLEIPLPSTIVYYRAEVDYVYPGINIEGYFDAERYANGVAGWNIDYIPSGDPNQVYARVLLTVKVTDDCFVLASTDPECELAIEVNGTLEGTSYVNGVYFKKESFISGFADETGCQGNAIRNDIKVVVNKENYVNNNCQDQEYTVRLVTVCGNDFSDSNPIPFMKIYALYPQGSRFFNAESGVEYTEATGFPISLAGDNASSAALIHVQPTSIYSAACTSDLRFILDPDGDSFTTPTLTNSATYCLDAEADSLSSHITSTPPSDIYYRFYKEISNSAVAYVDIVPPTDVEGTYTYYVRQFRENAIGCEDETFYGPITIEVVSPITFSSSKVSPSCIGEAVTITGTPTGGTWSWDATTLTGISVSGNVLTIDGTTAGTYAVTYTHNSPGTAGYNCTSTERTYVHQIASTTNAGRLEVDQTICQGAQIQPLQIVGHNGHVERWEWTTVSSSTQWDIIPNNTSSISTADLGELAEGTYYFKALVKDGNCAEAWTNVVTITVTNNNAPNSPTVTSPQYACIGTEYTIQPNNGNYQWYEQEIGGWPIKDANGNLANSVTITVTDEWITRYVSVVDAGTRCVSNRAEVQVRPNLEPGQINNDGQRECDLNQTATTIGSYYDAEAYGGGTVEYQWYVQANGGTEQEISGATSATFTPSAYMGTEGEYIFIRKVRNSTCDNWQQSRGSWRLVVGIPDASIEAVPGHATICQNGGVELRLRVPASTAYSYQWYKDGIAIPNATGHEYIATVTGRYTAQVTHRASGCSATTRDADAIEVKYDDAAPTASSVTTTLNGCSIADAQAVTAYNNVIAANASGLGFNISDVITPADLLTLIHTETQTENPTGVCYQLVRTYTVTDQCGFSTTFTHTINVVDNVAPVISTTAENNKDWGCNPTIVAPTFTGTDNCAGDISASIDVVATGIVEEGCKRTQKWTANYTDACGNAATPVSVTYTWTEDNVAPTIGDNNLNTTLTSTDCKFTLPNFTSEVRAISSDNCTAGEALEITQNVAAGTTYTPGTTPQTVTVTVTVKDACGNTSTKDIVVTIPAALTASATATPVLCNGGNGSVALTVSGGTAPYRYAWSNGATSEDLSSVPAGTYTVTVTDANGCTATASATISQPAALTASATATPVLCNGGNGSVALTVSGGTTPYSYAWSNGATSEDLSSVSAGTYTVTVTDANGCTATASATVSQPSALTASATATPVLCNGGNGSVALTVSGGTTPYRYVWSNGATSEDLSSVSAGTYTVTVTDANGCTATASATVSQPSALTASATATPVLCNGGNGSVALTVSGGTTPYSYAWSNGATSEDLSSVPAGTYTVTVTDANGCQVTASATVNQPAALTVSATATHVLCNGGNGSVALTVSGGTTPYRYAWSNGATSEDLSSVSAGTYTVTVTDANGCTATASATVSQPSALTASATATDALCNGGNGSVELAVSGGTTPYSYVWSNGATTKDLSSVPAGTYTVTVTDANGCTATASATVSQPSALSVSLTTESETCAGDDGKINYTIEGGTANYTVVLSGGSVSQTANQTATGTYTFTGLKAGTYTVTVTDDHDCVATATATITLNNNFTVSPSNTAICSGATFTVTPTASHPAKYSWAEPTATGITGAEAGTNASNISGTLTNTTTSATSITYTVTATTANGLCTANPFNVVVTVYAPVTGGSIQKNFISCNVADTIVTLTNVTAGNGGYGGTYGWEKSTDNGTTWTPIPNSNGADYTPNYHDNLGTVLYRRKYSANCDEKPTNTVSVTYYGNIVAGNVTCTSGCAANYCSGSNISVTLSTSDITIESGASYSIQWQQSTNGATWTNISEATSATYTYTNPNFTSPIQFRYTITVTGCAAVPSNNVHSIGVWALPVVSIADIATLCPSEASTDIKGTIVTTTTPNYTYHWSPEGGLTLPNLPDPNLPESATSATSNTITGTFLTTNCNATYSASLYVVDGNGCQSNTATETFTVVDTEEPEISGTLATINVEGCTESAAPAAYTTVSALIEAGLIITDNCGLQEAVTSAQTSTGSCPIVITRTYTVKDLCGNSTTVSQTINVDDNTAPTISGTLATENVEGCAETAAPAAYTTVTALREAGLTIEDNCGLQEEVTSAQTSTGSCPIVITRTYTVKDLCDNSTTVSQTININQADFTMPANGSSTVACPSATDTPPTLPTVTDACGNTLSPIGDPVVSTKPVCEGTRTYTYTYRDCAGHSHDWTYTYTIEYEDFDMPEDDGTTVACASAITAPALPTVTDNCGNELTGVLKTGYPTATPACEGTVEYVYTFTDCEGNAHDWTYTYTIEYEDFDMPEDDGTTVACASAITAPALPTVTDNCDNTLTGVLKEGYPTATPACEGTVTYVYTFTDCEGNAHDWTYIYTIEYEDFDMPEDDGTTVACASAITAPALPEVTDNCGNELTGVLKEGYPTATPACEGTVTYVYTFTDCEGNAHDWTYIYTIEYEDFEMPEDDGTTVACASAITAPALPEVTDNCGNELTGVLKEGYPTATPACEGTVTYVYTFTDCEGNAHDWTYIYTIEYEDFEMPEDDGTTVACASAITAPALPEVTDNCGNELTGVLKEGYPTATPACEGTVTYVYTFTDCEGNAHDWTYTYTIEHPTLTFSGSINDVENVNACYSEEHKAQLLTADQVKAMYRSSCSREITVSTNDVVVSSSDCNWKITRTYNISDGGCNTDSKTMSVSGSDQTVPALTGTWPSNITGQDNCFANADTTGLKDDSEIKALYSDCSAITVIHEDENTLTSNCGWTVTRTYTITDLCGNTVMPKPTMSVSGSDQTVPALTGTWPANITGQDNCFANRNISGLKSDDAVKALYSDCSALTVTSSDAVTGDNCGWTVTRTYTITDACNNSVTNTMSVSGSDQTAPGITDPTLWPENITNKNSCFANADISGLYNDNQVKNLYKDCGAIIVTHIDSNVSTHDCDWTIMRIYTVKDECGNTVMPKPTMSVSGRDQTTPSIMPTVLDRTLTATGCEFIIPDMREEVRAISSDGCTDNSTLTVEQPSAGMQVYPQVIARDTNVIIRVTDACGNYSLKSVKITIPAKVVITATATPASICNGETAQLSTTVANVVGAASYVWEPATGLNSTTIYNPTTTLTATGAPETVTYTVQVTDANGCTATATTFVTVNPEVVINALADTVINSGTAVPAKFFTTPLTGGVMTYSWTRTNTDVVTGMDPTGIGNVPGATLYNNTNTAKTTTITVTPTFTANGISCVGATVSYMITVNPTVVMNDVEDQAICHGSEIEPVTFGTTITDANSFVYNWVRTNTANVTGLTETGSGNIDATALYNETDQVQVTTFTVTPTYFNNGISSTGTPITFTITVNPKVVMNTVANQAICHGSEMAAVNFTTPITDGSVVYNWRRTNSNVVGLAMSGTGNIPATVLTNTTNTAQVDTITVTPVYTNNGNECTDESITFTITVNPKVVMNDVVDQAICHGSEIAAVNFTTPITDGSVVYNWSRDNNYIGGLAMSGTGNIAAVTLTNTTSTAQTTTITVIPVYTNNGNECTDESITFTITVNPKVVMNDVVDQAICHGSEMAAVNFTTPITDGSVVYNWTRDNENIGGLAMSGTGNIAAATLTNTTNTAQTTTITVTPVYTNNENTCTDETITFTITVNPKVVMNDVVDQAICHGSEMAAVNFTTPITDGTVVYNWTRDNENIGGLAMSGTGNIAAATLTNTTNTAQTTTITVTPVYTNNENTCTDETITFTITVNPKVVMNDVVDQAICHGSEMAAVNFTTPITDGTVVYNWTRTNNNIGGLDMSGTGNIPATILTNTTNTAQVDIITVTPVYTNNGNECTDESITFTITVNPKVVMNDVVDQAICHGSEMAAVNFTTPITDGSVGYNWTRTNSNISGLDMSGTGNIPATILTNTTNTAQVDTIKVTPVYTNNGNECTDESITFTITVNPKVVMNDVADQAICHGSEMAAVNFTTPITDGSVVYNWTRTNNNIGGLAMSGTGNIAAATLTNTTNTAQTTTITVIPVYTNNGNECTDESITFTITVNPEVVMNTVEDWTLCVGETSPEYVYTSTITDGTVTYGWRNNTPAIGLAASGTGNLPSFVAANATPANLIAEVKVAPTYANNGISCQGDSINFFITVRPSITTLGNVEFTCPRDTTVVLSYSECEQFVNIGYPEFVNNMTGMTVNITNDAPAGNIFPEGTTIVTWTATDECGAALTCTQSVVIQFPSCGDTIADFDGYRYSSVRIGCQCWTGENARSEHYSDGTPVDNFRYYNDSDSLENIYGKLYTWYTAVRVPEGDNNAEPSISTDPLGRTYVQGICPEGWALPTVDEYMLMIANSGDATHAKDGSNLYWLPGYEGQPPFSGFDAYGAGLYNGAIDRYQDLLGKTYFWTTLSGSGSETATTVEINYYCAEGLQTELSKGDGVSIRCIRKR